MSKRKHKSRKDTRRETTSDNINDANVNNSSNNRQTYNNGPFGINPNQLLSSMFGNIDMGQINSILQSMNTQGFDFNNLNLGNLQNLMGSMGNIGNMGSVNNPGTRVGQTAQNGKDLNKNDNEEDEDITLGKVTDENIKNNHERNDENIQMLMAIRSIVSGERGAFIDKVITMYNNGEFDE